MNKNSNILVTGASGLVGSNLINQLNYLGYKNVIALTRKECDLLDPKKTENYFIEKSPEYVFHCAGKVYGIGGNLANKGISFYENCMINLNVIESSRISHVKKITAMGTGAVYPSNPISIPLKENEIFYGPPHDSENSYANAKRAMLSMLESYKESYNLDYAYVISCNLFGPNDNFDPYYGHVIPSLIYKFYEGIKNDSPVSIWGNGSAQRDFLYVKDTVNSLIEIMLRIDGSVNIGSGNVFCIKDIVDILVKVTGFNNIIWDETKPNGQDYRAYDLNILRTTNFKTQFSIEEGLKETWQWYVDQKK